MSKNVFLFSGQGSQYPEMGIELAKRYPSSARIYECAADILKMDVKALCADASETELAQTKNAQPAIFTTSLLALNAMQEEDISFEAVAGHSLGEYAAMVAAKMITLEDGYRLIQHRAAAMDRCAQEHPGSMCAVMGMEADEIEKICAAIEGYVVPVNYNSPAQTVIAGDTSAIDRAIAQFTEQGKKCIRLAVSAAFHSKFMQSAAEELFGKIQKISFQTPSVLFYSNVTGKPLEDFSNMPAYLCTHLTSPVRFTDELKNLSEAGFEHYIELGPNKVLTGLVKKTLKGSSAFQVENDKTLDKVLEKLKI